MIDNAWGWGSNDPHSLYTALSDNEQAELERLASNYDRFEDTLEDKYQPHFCDPNDNECEKRCSYGPGQRFDSAFKGGCVDSADHEKFHALKRALSQYLNQMLARHHCTKEYNGRIYW